MMNELNCIDIDILYRLVMLEMLKIRDDRSVSNTYRFNIEMASYKLSYIAKSKNMSEFNCVDLSTFHSLVNRELVDIANGKEVDAQVEFTLRLLAYKLKVLKGSEV